MLDDTTGGNEKLFLVTFLFDGDSKRSRSLFFQMKNVLLNWCHQICHCFASLLATSSLSCQSWCRCQWMSFLQKFFGKRKKWKEVNIEIALNLILRQVWVGIILYRPRIFFKFQIAMRWSISCSNYDKIFRWFINLL